MLAQVRIQQRKKISPALMLLFLAKILS